MEPNIANQEIILFAGTSFSKKEYAGQAITSIQGLIRRLYSWNGLAGREGYLKWFLNCLPRLAETGDLSGMSIPPTTLCLLTMDSRAGRWIMISRLTLIFFCTGTDQIDPLPKIRNGFRFLVNTFSLLSTRAVERNGSVLPQ